MTGQPDEQRIIIEMGTGNDLHGEDYTKAAIRAVEDAFRHSSLPLFESLGLSHREMRVQVTVGVQRPERIDIAAVTAHLPRGLAEVRAVKGGLNVHNAELDATIVIATAAVEAFLPSQKGRWQTA
ncbi:MAG TPA: Lin0512 family protein [Thermohalobaculum sp.]|nr:Lin0512 family protein [Thermohalobaculum sp.]